MVGTHKPKGKIVISNIDKIGIVHLQGTEKFLEKNEPEKCFLITASQPHENVLKYAEHIQLLEIIVSTNFKEEKEKIERKYKDSEIVTVDPYQLAGRDGMLDGA